MSQEKSLISPKTHTFYNAKKQEWVDVDEQQIMRAIFKKNKTRYALETRDQDVLMTKFIRKREYNQYSHLQENVYTQKVANTYDSKA